MVDSKTESTGEVLNINPSVVEHSKKEVVVKGVKQEVRNMQKGGFWWGTGRRKSAVARVRIKPGEGTLIINKKPLDEYFHRPVDKNAVMSPLKAVDGEKKFNIFANVKGGGTTGQAGAVLLGIARALKNYDATTYLSILRDGGYLTRDGRMVERKKYGLRKARRAFQFSKR